MAAFAVTFDYLCPFARIANEVVLRALDAGAGHQVDFRAFSLSQVHLGEGEQPVWLAEQPPSGVLALEWGLAVRDELPERFPAAHLAIFEARHDHGRNLNDPEVLRDAVASAGLDSDEVEKLVMGGRPAGALAADHTWAVEEHRGFGLPTFVTGGPGGFVPRLPPPGHPPAPRATPGPP